MSLLARPIIRMPQLTSGMWLNSPSLTREALRGRVVLIDFWDYSCVNCVRTLPYLTRWHATYAAIGLVTIGIHTPEFRFARVEDQVRQALDQYAITYPILLDNQMQNWDSFTTKAWPTKYLIDAKGYIRYQRRGEGGYHSTERAIQALLREQNPDLELPSLQPPLRPEDAEGAVCYTVTPELHAGFLGGIFGGSLANPEGYIPDQALLYAMPQPETRQAGGIYISGFWQAQREALVFAGQEAGRVAVPYGAVGVNAVLSPTADEVDLRLGMGVQNGPLWVEVKQNGRWLDPLIAGSDVHFDTDGRSRVPVDRPRMYHLIQHVDYTTGELEFIVRSRGLAVFTFTFTSCVRSFGN